jgi:hypothetical protein
MRALILCSACVLALGAAPAMAAKSPAKSAVTCDARYYGYLVGKGVDEARSINGSNYRVLPNGSDRGAEQPKRMTIMVDARSNLITDVSCG